MDENRIFPSVQEELAYWKSKAREYQQSLEDVKCELDEYQTESKELEMELESQLEQAETKCRELRTQNNRLLMENNTIKEKIEHVVEEYNSQIDGLQTEINEIRRMRDELVSYVRELEQVNDDLERQNRAAVASVEDFESRLNQAIERNAFLESELDEKETLSVMVQRLKDESKELRQELQVRSHNRETLSNGLLSSSPGVDKSLSPKIESSKLAKEYRESPLKGVNGHSVPLTPSARVSALNIVGDLLRRVGALESKLASCKTLVKDTNRANTVGSKEITRAAASPANPSPRQVRVLEEGVSRVHSSGGRTASIKNCLLSRKKMARGNSTSAVSSLLKC